MTKFKPYVARLAHSKLFPTAIVAREAFQGAMVVYERPAIPDLGPLGVGVSALWWHSDRLTGPHASVIRDENTSLPSALLRIKKAMLDHGAVAEAVELIGALSPFDEKELKIMADKLAKKAPAAKKTPAPAPKGNPEALKKAREARTADANVDKTYKTIVKRDTIKARDETWTKAMIDIAFDHTSTHAAAKALAKHKVFGDRRIDWSWLVKKGYISQPK